MSRQPAQFYDEWADEQLGRENRADILRWKAGQLMALCEQEGLALEGDVVEIGCAEGILVARLQEAFSGARCHGLDISRRFIERGRELFPRVEFRSQSHVEFFREIEHVRFVVLSDLLEHLPDDEAFLREVVPHCDYLLLKIPIELCVYDSWRCVRALRRLVGKVNLPPPYGPEHPDGHVRGYTVGGARRLLRSTGQRVLRESVRTVHQFYDRSGLLDVIGRVSERLCVRLFGGAYFALTRAGDQGRR